MRKQTAFAIVAATLIAEVIAFWTITSVVETTASVRSKVTEPTTRVIHATPTPYLSVREMEPVY